MLVLTRFGPIFCVNFISSSTELRQKYFLSLRNKLMLKQCRIYEESESVLLGFYIWRQTCVKIQEIAQHTACPVPTFPPFFMSFSMAGEMYSGGGVTISPSTKILSTCSHISFCSPLFQVYVISWLPCWFPENIRTGTVSAEITLRSSKNKLKLRKNRELGRQFKSKAIIH